MVAATVPKVRYTSGRSSIAPGHQSGGRLLVAAVPAGARRARECRILERGRGHAEPRRGAQPVAVEPQLGAHRRQRFGEDGVGAVLDRGQSDGDPRFGDAEPLGGQVGGELGALPQDQLGSPLLHGRQHPRQGGANVGAREHLAQHHPLGFLVGEMGQAGDDRGPHLGWGVGERPVLEPGPSHLGGERLGRSNDDFMAGPATGSGEGHQGAEVAQPGGGGNQHSHGPGPYA
jgi:hypothetical protein